MTTTTKQHQDYTNWIINSVSKVCPYTDPVQSRTYTSGFLASYLASILEQDPYQFRQFKRHIESVSKREHN